MAASGSRDSEKGKVTLSGAQETLLLTLLARALDAESPNPILDDKLSAKIKKRIQDEHGYNFDKRVTSMSSGFMAKMISARAKMFDEAVEDFLRDNPGPATILHLACGMDTRCHRVKWQGPGRVWIDVDKEDVVELRKVVVEDPEVAHGQGEYRLESPDIIRDSDWLGDLRVPTDRPVLVMFEGLVMYLFPDQVLGMFRKIMRHFEAGGKGGQMHFDSIGPLGYFFVRYFASQPLARMGASMGFYMSNGHWLENNIPGLQQIKRDSQFAELVQKASYPWVVQVAVRFVDKILGGTLAGGVYGFKF